MGNHCLQRLNDLSPKERPLLEQGIVELLQCVREKQRNRMREILELRKKCFSPLLAMRHHDPNCTYFRVS